MNNKEQLIITSTPDKLDKHWVGEVFISGDAVDFEVFRNYCMTDIKIVMGNFGLALKQFNNATGKLNHQLVEYVNQLKEPEKHDFKCQANHRDKGHVKPFYRQGRW